MTGTNELSHSRATVWASVIGGICVVIASLVGGAKVGRHDADTTIEKLSGDLQERDKRLDQLEGQLESREAQVVDLTVKLDKQQEAIQELSRELRDFKTQSREREQPIVPQTKEEPRSRSDEPKAPGSPAESLDNQTADDRADTFQGRKFIATVVAAEVEPEESVVVVELRPRKDSVIVQLNPYKTFLLDRDGNRWGMIGKARDTLGLFTDYAGIELLPDTAVRSRIQLGAFDPPGIHPNPKPPFTFIAMESRQDERIVIQGIRPD